MATTTTTETAVPVTVDNFIRAETDMYFERTIQANGGLGKLLHSREMVDIDHQIVVRMNRDTLYSSAVFDLDAGPVKLTLPDAGKRFMSLMAVNQDHEAFDVAYAPGTFGYDRKKAGTRYLTLAVRTLADPSDAKDMAEAHAAQDAIRVEQPAAGTWEAPNWDAASRDKIRGALNTLAGDGFGGAGFGRKEDVDPVARLIGTAVGWGGNPKSAAMYQGVSPKANDGKTAHVLRLSDVPVDGFWSITIYDEKGFLKKNDLGAYSVNNVTGEPDADGSFTIRFGGCDGQAPNCLPIFPGWNYLVRLYRPRKELLDGTWKIPEAKPVG
jgi:para-nitrobenzyl esterase